MSENVNDNVRLRHNKEDENKKRRRVFLWVFAAALVSLPAVLVFHNDGPQDTSTVFNTPEIDDSSYDSGATTETVPTERSDSTLRDEPIPEGLPVSDNPEALNPPLDDTPDTTVPSPMDDSDTPDTTVPSPTDDSDTPDTTVPSPMDDDEDIEEEPDPATAPGAPTDVTLEMISLTAFLLEWDAPSSDGGSPISGYTIEHSNDGVSWSVMVENQSGVTLSVSDLPTGSFNFFRVAAENEVGRSPFSTSVSDLLAVVPESPENVDASLDSEGSTDITLTWDAPAFDGGHAITGYLVSASLDGGEWFEFAETTELQISAFDLENDATYRFKVQAVNIEGESSPAYSANVETPPAAFEAPVVSATVTESSSPTVLFSWGDTLATEQEISSDGGENWTAISGTSHLVNASFGESYELRVRVRDCNLEACTLWVISEPAVVSVGSPLTAPETPTVGGVTPTVAESSHPKVTFTWVTDSVATEQEISVDGAPFISSPLEVTSETIDAEFATTYEFTHRQRTCVTGNTYNDFAVLCSDWLTTTSAPANVLSPVAVPAKPESAVVAATVVADSTPQVSFSWAMDSTATEQEVSVDSGSWTSRPLGTSSEVIDAAFASSHFLQQRQRTCVAGNAYNDFESVCSSWAVSNVSGEVVGSPLSAPASPSPATAFASEDASSSPTVTFSWTGAAGTEQQYSVDSSDWTGIDIADSSVVVAASFATTHTFSQRHRDCIAGNAYNDFATLCSAWVESNSVSESIGSPLSAPADPAAASVTASEEADSTPTVTFNWTADPAATEQEISVDRDAFFPVPLTANSEVVDASFDTTHTMVQRQRTCIPGNVYNNFATLCSAWVTSNTASEPVGGPLSPPDTPPSLTVSSTEEADSTPRVQFTWTGVTPSEQQYSYNGDPFAPMPATQTEYGYFNASFGTTYTFQVRHRDCSAGNVYNDNSQLCSDWATSNVESVSVGTPLSTPPEPSSIAVSSEEEEDPTPRVQFTWADSNPTEQQVDRSWDGQSGWVTVSNTATSEGYFNASFGTTYTMQVRARNCVTGNSYNDGATLCSDWTESNTRSEAVGNPVAEPAMPAAITITPHEEADSSPRYRFTWTATSPYQLQYRTATCSGNNPSCSTWTAYQDRTPSTSTSYGWLNASFNTTYRFDLRSRNCVAGNSYNTSTNVCSDWREVTAAHEYIGSPISAPAMPSTFSISGSTGDLHANFSWVVANNSQQLSVNGGSWATTGSSSTSYTVSSPSYSTTYTLRARARNCTAGNDYNDGVTQCSDWRYSSNTSSVTTPPVPGPSVSGWSRWTTTDHTEFGSITRRHVYVNFSGTANVQFFWDPNCSGNSSSVYTNRTGSSGASSTSWSGWVYNTYNGGSVRLTDTSTGGVTCSNNGW